MTSRRPFLVRKFETLLEARRTPHDLPKKSPNHPEQALLRAKSLPALDVDQRGPGVDVLATRTQNDYPNIIVFGETGAGKSSIVNMLEGETADLATVNSQANGVTFQNQVYVKEVLGQKYNVFDTIGLNEVEAGTVPATEAIVKLHDLMRELERGVNLLVFVMRGPRIKETAVKNYDIFFDIFCQRQVPIVIVVTGLEELQNMDGWWVENENEFLKKKMVFKGSACVTASRGKARSGIYTYQAEYEESERKIRALIYSHCGSHPWVSPVQSWFTSVLLRLYNHFALRLGWDIKVASDRLYKALRAYGGVGEEEAREMAKNPEAYLKRTKSTRQEPTTEGAPAAKTTRQSCSDSSDSSLDTESIESFDMQRETFFFPPLTMEDPKEINEASIFPLDKNDRLDESAYDVTHGLRTRSPSPTEIKPTVMPGAVHRPGSETAESDNDDDNRDSGVPHAMPHPDEQSVSFTEILDSSSCSTDGNICPGGFELTLGEADEGCVIS